MKIINKTISELKERWKSETPDFWKKTLKFSLTLGTSAAGVIAVDKFFGLQDYGVSPIIFTVCGYIITFCGALGLAAKLTKQ